MQQTKTQATIKHKKLSVLAKSAHDVDVCEMTHAHDGSRTTTTILTQHKWLRLLLFVNRVLYSFFNAQSVLLFLAYWIRFSIRLQGISDIQGHLLQEIRTVNNSIQGCLLPFAKLRRHRAGRICEDTVPCEFL